MQDFDIVSRSIVPSDWPALERLFGKNGACGGCWCMLWRVPSMGAHWATVKGKKNKAAFRKLVQSGQALGCLAWSNDEPIGWCSVGPREHYPYLQRSRSIPDPGISDVWCVTCFYIPAPWRGRGVARQLLNTALDYSRSAGAAALEGYPTVPGSATRPVPPAFAHTGLPRLFEAVGFDRVCDIGARQLWRVRFEHARRRR